MSRDASKLVDLVDRRMPSVEVPRRRDVQGVTIQ